MSLAIDLMDHEPLVVDSHITILPVLNGGRLVGVISKSDLVRAPLSKMGGNLDRVPALR